MTSLKACPNCRGNRFSEYCVVQGGYLTAEIEPGVKIDTVIATRYCRCQNCSLIFQNPRLSDKELNIYYGSGHYRRTVNPMPEGMDRGESNRAKTDARIIKQQLGKRERHLDVGCGHGYLLKEVGAGTKVGIESDRDYVNVAGLSIYSEIEELPSKNFDLVTAIHVLEHIPYPLDYLKKLKRFVGKNGYLVIEVPSLKTRGGPFGFAHLHYFEPDVLKLMCLEAGFKVVDVEFTPHLMLICEKEEKAFG